MTLMHFSIARRIDRWFIGNACLSGILQLISFYVRASQTPAGRSLRIGPGNPFFFHPGAGNELFWLDAYGRQDFNPILLKTGPNG